MVIAWWSIGSINQFAQSSLAIPEDTWRSLLDHFLKDWEGLCWELAPKLVWSAVVVVIVEGSLLFAISISCSGSRFAAPETIVHQHHPLFPLTFCHSHCWYWFSPCYQVNQNIHFTHTHTQTIERTDLHSSTRDIQSVIVWDGGGKNVVVGSRSWGSCWSSLSSLCWTKPNQLIVNCVRLERSVKLTCLVPSSPAAAAAASLLPHHYCRCQRAQVREIVRLWTL